MITESSPRKIFQSQIFSRLTENILKSVIPWSHLIQAGEGLFRSFSDAKTTCRKKVVGEKLCVAVSGAQTVHSSRNARCTELWA